MPRRPASPLASGSRRSARLKRTERQEEVLDGAVPAAQIGPKKCGSRNFKRTKREEDVVSDDDVSVSRISPKNSSALRAKKEKGNLVDNAVSRISNGDSATSAKKVEDENKEKEMKSKLTGDASEVKVDDDDQDDPESRFIGDVIPCEEAHRRWPHRYKIKQSAASKGTNKKEEAYVLQARCHYTQAEIDGRVIINLYDNAYVQGEEGESNYIGKVIEMFETVNGEMYFTAQWFYRARDTPIKYHDHLIDDKRVFFSEIKDDNPLDCLLEKLNIVKVPLDVNLQDLRASVPHCDYYYNMLYLVPFCTFVKVPPELLGAESETISTVSTEVNADSGSCNMIIDTKDGVKDKAIQKSELTLLDLYAGCGAMSTGLCLGAHIANINLVTKWAVDINAFACESLKFNHPETEVRNEAAEDFLSLLKEWRKLCIMFSLIDGDTDEQYFDPSDVEDDENNNSQTKDDGEIFEVDYILGICYGKPKDAKKKGLHFKVRWKGYGPNEDSWEPQEGLRNCRERVKKFVINGNKLKILPLSGDVDVICGGPPCQGISGFNRFRNKENPLKDPKNEQLLVFMNIVEYLKPRFVLMENVVDLIRFSDAFLGRYALSRLIQMNYQTRMGMMAAGSYGLPQYRKRVFIWGALPTETLPKYPLPTHDVVIKAGVPVEFIDNMVCYDEGQHVKLERKLLLKDAISDLPAVTNSEQRDEMQYEKDPESDFQKFIRLSKDELLNSTSPSSTPSILYDHQPLQLNADDYERVCHIPKQKGANFRNLRGVRVREDNKKVEFDPNIERVLLSSGKPLVPDYAMSFVRGISTKPFGRLWWDETVPTVVTRAEPHNQIIIHPVQDRVLTIRENARLQGFSDFYKLCGPVKERYIQVGNAVAVPVARALGYSLGLAIQGLASKEPVFTLPRKSPFVAESLTPPVSSEGEV